MMYNLSHLWYPNQKIITVQVIAETPQFYKGETILTHSACIHNDLQRQKKCLLEM